MLLYPVPRGGRLGWGYIILRGKREGWDGGAASYKGKVITEDLTT
jgi:hypothetical protein